MRLLLNILLIVILSQFCLAGSIEDINTKITLSNDGFTNINQVINLNDPSGSIKLPFFGQDAEVMDSKDYLKHKLEKDNLEIFPNPNSKILYIRYDTSYLVNKVKTWKLAYSPANNEIVEIKIPKNYEVENITEEYTRTNTRLYNYYSWNNHKDILIEYTPQDYISSPTPLWIYITIGVMSLMIIILGIILLIQKKKHKEEKDSMKAKIHRNPDVSKFLEFFRGLKIDEQDIIRILLKNDYLRVCIKTLRSEFPKYLKKRSGFKEKGESYLEQITSVYVNRGLEDSKLFLKEGAEKKELISFSDFIKHEYKLEDKKIIQLIKKEMGVKDE